MKCGRPKWMLRQLFQVFFLSILIVLVVVAVLAYLIYFLPAYPHHHPVLSSVISSNNKAYPQQQQNHQRYHHYPTLEDGSAIDYGHNNGLLTGRKVGVGVGGGGGPSSSQLDGSNQFQDLHLIPLETAPIRHVSKNSLYQKKDRRKKEGAGEDWMSQVQQEAAGIGQGQGEEYPRKCSMFTCFDIHRCGGGTVPSSTNSSLSIYVYPIYQWVVDGKKIQNSLSREFYQFLLSIKKSPFYVSDPNQACIFVPSIDLLNLNRLTVSSDDILAALSSLEFWGSTGQNHVLLTMHPGNSPLLHLKTNAIIASSGLFIEHYRLGFHVPVITPSPLLFSSSNHRNSIRTSNSDIIILPQQSNNAISSHRRRVNVGEGDGMASNSNQQLLQVRNPNWLAVAVQQGISSFNDLLSSANHDNSILLLDYCHNSSVKKQRTDSSTTKNSKNNQSQSYGVRCASSTHNRGVISETFQYPDILREFDFCLVVRDIASPVLWEVMSVGCIPVIIADHQRLPFDEFIDWRRNSIQFYEHQMHQLSSILSNVSERRRRRLKAQVQLTFNRYFKDMNAITGTLMKALNARVFAHYAESIQEWNSDDGSETNLVSNVGSESVSLSLSQSHSCSNVNVQSPLFNPVIASKDSGFTAVILAYERVTSLFSVIQRVAQVPSLVKILVVWNNQLKDPPSLDSWPKVGVPVKIIKTKENKMSNRFFPYNEIETEAVFSLDDDIIMLTVDEMEFAFEAWREYPDRIVGFPSRSHVWDNSTHRWKYESEWTSEISMVLTGAAFYHKYWHYAYTNELNKEIRDWVDSKMNCEDIAMNFLISARTGKSPIKVTPRKKFKCPTCSNNEMLSSDSGHMVERTDCINKFSQIMGFMPLISTEFRADPVLFKVDGVPKRLKRYHDMGTL